MMAQGPRYQYQFIIYVHFVNYLDCELWAMLDKRIKCGQIIYPYTM